MKILHVINTVCAGGAELHLLTLCRHLKQKGVTVSVACLKDQVEDTPSLRPDFEKEGIEVFNLHGQRRFQIACLFQLLTLVSRIKPDIVHTHLPRADFIGSLMTWFYPSIPWVSSMHDVYSRSWSGSWALPLFNLVWRRADAVIAISEAVKDWLVTERRIPCDKIKVIHYGIDPGRFVQSNVSLRNAWGFDGEPLLGSVGRLEERKGHDCLIRAMPEILKVFSGATLLIAGHDPWGYGRTLEALIDRLGLKTRVRLIGFQEDVSSFLHAVDVFVFGSRSEGFGQVIIEAMAAGKPVIASRLPPLTEIISDAETGLLVEPDDPGAFARAIIWTLSNPEEILRMGSQGRKRVAQLFLAEKMSSNILSQYVELIEERA